MCSQEYIDNHHNMIVHPLVHKLGTCLALLWTFPLEPRHKKVHRIKNLHHIFLLFFHETTSNYGNGISMLPFRKSIYNHILFSFDILYIKENSWNNSTHQHCLRLNVGYAIKNLRLAWSILILKCLPKK